jgi:hypothetical protein
MLHSLGIVLVKVVYETRNVKCPSQRTEKKIALVLACRALCCCNNQDLDRVKSSFFMVCERTPSELANNCLLTVLEGLAGMR